MSQTLFKFGWSHYERMIKSARERYYADADMVRNIYTNKNRKLLQKWGKAIESARHFVEKKYGSKTADNYLAKERYDYHYASSARQPALPVSYQPYWQRAY